jgi:hypothetical protein
LRVRKCTSLFCPFQCFPRTKVSVYVRKFNFLPFRQLSLSFVLTFLPEVSVFSFLQLF